MPRARLDLRRVDALGLPVEACVPSLRAALAGRGLAVLQAEPGAGKTTVVPLRLADDPWLDGRRIVVLEPRRLAARAAARRMADLLDEPVGETVGFVTRDERRVGSRTRVEVVTEGILTRRLQRDPSLDGVGLVMFDEFHERSLQADLGLAFTLEARRALRPDLRVLVASATIDADRVAALLGDADGAGGSGAGGSEDGGSGAGGSGAGVLAVPVVQAEGRTHPVSVQWKPPPPRAPLEPAVAEAVVHALGRHDGDVLVFLPGAAVIHRTAALMGERRLPGDAEVDVRLLFGAMASADQDAALGPAPAGRRKVVLATDIAETSLTVDGVGVVVDSGLARVPRFDPRTGMTRLQTVSISRASADQRAGRAGRTGPGAAIRLWSKLSHAARPSHTPAEITQVDLAGFALELAEWGATDPAGLALLDQPPAAALTAAWELLGELGAVDGERRLTAAGRSMAALPLHPRLAAIVVAGLAAEADRAGQLATACAIAALLDDRDVLRGRPDDVPAELRLRLGLLVDRRARHPAADPGALRTARRRADELIRRTGRAGGSGGAGDARGPGGSVGVGRLDLDAAGRLLLAGYPDRLGQRSGGPGRFRLRTGTGAWVPPHDDLSADELVVVADLDGDRRQARIRVAAGVDRADVLDALAARVTTTEVLVWDEARDELVARREQRLGALVLASHVERPSPGPATVAALVDRVRDRGLDALGWTDAARRVQQRLGFLHARHPDQWPDVGDRHLLATLDDWLAPLLVAATGRADLDQIDLAAALGTRLTHDQRVALDRLAPASVVVPSGRRVPLDWSGDAPVLAVRVQELYGSTDTPTVLDGAVPVVLHLLSPAGRPVQVTSDLAGFWAGSWKEVRKEMAGRYPKHDWPADPASARPPSPGRGRSRR